MLFTTEQADEVKSWMAKKLETISDADPEILTEYCWAILQSEADVEEIRKSAVENLEDFLKDHTVRFVDEVFAKYAPKKQPLPPLPAPAAAKSKKSGKIDQHVRPLGDVPISSTGDQRLASNVHAGKKRSHLEAITASGQETLLPSNGSAASKLPHSRRGRPSDRNLAGRGIYSQQLAPALNNPSFPPMMNMPLPPTPPPGFGFPEFDPTNPMAAYAFMQSILPQMTSMLALSPNAPMQNFDFKPRCHDYDDRGFCILGNSCPFAHGIDHLVARGNDEYDPTRAMFNMAGGSARTARVGSSGQRPAKGRGSRQMPDAKHKRMPATFSRSRPQADMTSTALVVEGIPDGSVSRKAVGEYFSQFGSIRELKLQLEGSLAIVRFDTHASARRAWESPEAAFDNRFVKIYWYRPDLDKGTSEAEVEEATFKKRQREKQKAHEERMKTRRATDEARQDLRRRRQIVSQEHETLVRKLAAAQGLQLGPPDTTNGTKEGLNGSSSNVTTDPRIQALRDQLAEMQAEAKSLGIDPDAPSEYTHYYYPYNNGGSGSYGSNYGATSFVRGRDPSVRKLDNRPKSIAVSGVVFDTAKDENLRTFLTTTGPFEAVQVDPRNTDSRVVVFRERWQAEQVMHGRTAIPGVGKVELSWVQDGMIQASSGQQASNGDSEMDDSGMEEGEDDEEDEEGKDEETRDTFDLSDEAVDENLDVAGGDDDGWDNIR